MASQTATMGSMAAGRRTIPFRTSTSARRTGHAIVVSALPKQVWFLKMGQNRFVGYSVDAWLIARPSGVWIPKIDKVMNMQKCSEVFF